MVYGIAFSKKLSDVYTLNKGETFAFNIDGEFEERYNYKLRLIGEVGIPFSDRTEDVYPLYFRKIEDSLSFANGEYLLNFSDYNLCYERSCYHLARPNVKKGDSGLFSVRYKNYSDNQNIVVSMEVFYGKPFTRYYYETPDLKLSFNLESVKEFKVLEKELTFDKEVDFIMVKISGVGFTGDAGVFAPKLVINGENVIAPFEYNPKEITDGKWIGEGFSITERPLFSLKHNGLEIFKGHKTDRLQHFYGCTFDILENSITDKNVFELCFLKENKFPYIIKEIQLIKTPKEFEVLGVSSWQTKNKKFGALAYFPFDTEVKLDLPSGIKYLGQIKVEKGVSVLSFISEIEGENVNINVTACGKIRVINVEKIYSDNEDGVLTGSGDFIYINQNAEDFCEYLAWYLNGNVGNMLTFRGCYRWGMTSEMDETFWKKSVQLLENLGIYYSLMIDGRELNGINANPPLEILEGEYFLGEQTHERDGAYTYWTQRITDYEAFYYHVLSRKLKRNGMYGKLSPVYSADGSPNIFYSPDDPKTVDKAYERMLDNLKSTASDGATRHTGVTPYFDTFLKAGYKWVGYESMYGPHELMFGAVRGMSRSAGQDNYGAHLALQWSTVPCDNVAHYVRYRLSLYLSYMHGVSQINTEEGLWNIENPFIGADRFSEACINHKKEQAEFYRFKLAHMREGRLSTRIAMIVGKYDGMDCFSAGKVYGVGEKSWEYSSPEKSWDMLKTFYPEAEIGALYFYVKKGEKTADKERDNTFMDAFPGLYKKVCGYKSLGYFSSTPYGAIDIISESAENLSDYKFLFFTGWNTCTEDLLMRLISFMQGGGTVLLAKVHLYDNVVRQDVLSGKGTVIKSKLLDEFFSYENSGNLVYIDKDLFPSEMGDRYANELKRAGEKFGSEFIKNSKHVSFTEYVSPDGITTLYLIDINWWDDLAATCNLELDNFSYDVSLLGNRVRVLKISPNKRCAVMTDSIDVDIHFVKNGEIFLNGFGEVKYTLFKDGLIQERTEKVSGKKIVVI